MAPPPHEHEDEEIHIAVWFIVAIAGVTLLLITIIRGWPLVEVTL
jgi:hypothetical protein